MSKAGLLTTNTKQSKRRGSTLAPTPSDSRSSASTCLSSEQTVEEASLWRRVGSVHVQVRAQRPVCLVDVDFFEALHLNHLHPTTRVRSFSVQRNAPGGRWRQTSPHTGIQKICLTSLITSSAFNHTSVRWTRAEGCSTSFCQGMETLPVTNLW